MTPYKFIPPKDRDEDFNPMIDRMIEEEMELKFIEDTFETDIRDGDEADDLININIG